MVRIAVEAGMPVVPRGAGTGLSGGALPVPGCVLLGLSRMKRILEVDLDDGWIRVQPGVINLDVSKEISAAGYYYAPDPSSQGVCTIGGNVAENSGGAHCLKYGFTVNHVLGVRLVTADGEVVDLGGPALDTPGYDLLGVVVGSEGTLGVVTEVSAPDPPQARGHPHLLRHLPLHRRGRDLRLGDHRHRHRPGGHRDDGPPGDPGGGRRDRGGLARRGRGAADGRGRLRRRGRAHLRRWRWPSPGAPGRSRCASRRTTTSGC